MGGTSNGHMNAFQKERLGWLNYGSSPPIRTVTASGVYTLDPYAPAGSGSKALRILKSVDGSGKRTWYYLEARTQNGFDSGTAPGVIVHTGSEATGNSSNMFDLDRTTSAMDPVLDVGQTYTDTTRGLSFRTSVADALGAMVEVIMTDAPCSALAPTVTVAPANMVTTSPGALVNYTVTVRNNDESTCGPATFGLAGGRSVRMERHLQLERSDARAGRVVLSLAGDCVSRERQRTIRVQIQRHAFWFRSVRRGFDNCPGGGGAGCDAECGRGRREQLPVLGQRPRRWRARVGCRGDIHDDRFERGAQNVFRDHQFERRGDCEVPPQARRSEGQLSGRGHRLEGLAVRQRKQQLRRELTRKTRTGGIVTRPGNRSSPDYSRRPEWSLFELRLRPDARAFAQGSPGDALSTARSAVSKPATANDEWPPARYERTRSDRE